jgi:hypothetical protein
VRGHKAVPTSQSPIIAAIKTKLSPQLMPCEQDASTGASQALCQQSTCSPHGASVPPSPGPSRAVRIAKHWGTTRVAALSSRRKRGGHANRSSFGAAWLTHHACGGSSGHATRASRPSTANLITVAAQPLPAYKDRRPKTRRSTVLLLTKHILSLSLPLLKRTEVIPESGNPTLAALAIKRRLPAPYIPTIKPPSTPEKYI